MATKGSVIQFCAGTYAQYSGLAVKDANKVYFCQDTKQIFVGESEYTKSTKTLTSVPTSSTPGDDGALYAYNGALYLCKIDGSNYSWTRVANVNDYAGTMTSITVGEGLTNASGDDNPITVSGTVKHAIATGAEAHVDDVTDQTATFGGTVTTQSVATDKFGHVVGIYTHNITMPTETVLTVDKQADGATVELGYGDTFTVVAEVEKGDGSHEVVRTVKTFQLPESDQHDTTYTISSTKEGKVTVTPSVGESYDVTINGWNDLAKKSDISAVFQFKGTVATATDLPAEGMQTGYVYFVTADNSEYVYVNDAWEKLGPVIDLSAYAQTADVIARVTGKTGEVAKFTADGQIESTGFTLGCSVPSDAVFTDTVYTAPTYGAKTSGFYKFSTDANGYVDAVTAVTADDITALGIASEKYVDDAVAAATIKWQGIE